VAPSFSRSSSQSWPWRPRPIHPIAPGVGPLAFHGGVETVERHLAVLHPQHVLREVKREAIGIVELESDLTGKILAGAKLGGLFFQQAKAALEGPA